MDDIISKIVTSLTTEGTRLSVVRNPDRFLLRDDTRQKVLEETGLFLIPIASGLELRIRYELKDKYSEDRICYIMDNAEEILPDIKAHIFIAPTFSVSKLLPACNENELQRSKMTFGMASYIFDKNVTRNLAPTDTRALLKEAASLYGTDPVQIASELKGIKLEWQKNDTMESVCKILLEAISKKAYAEIEPAIDELNADFQKFIDDNYFSFINSSPLGRPKMVNKILPYLNDKHSRTDKVALIVVDGMTYWQYLILDKALSDVGITVRRDITLAWLPSITKLSRQAIFRGESPKMDYKQSPEEEMRLWREYWTSSDRLPDKRMQEYEVNYIHGSLVTDNYNPLRLAFVDVRLDEMMHALDNNKNLYDLTRNWAAEASTNIKAIHEQGYQIYITTDHGNVLAKPWRALTPKEKTFLYEKESRGKRHLIYSKKDYLDDFLQSNQEINGELLTHSEWTVWRNTQSFSNNCGITHGGAHFLEVVIPFVTIEKE